MTRFLHWSDLHREMSEAAFPTPSADCPAGSVDAVLIAGDLNARGAHLDDAMRIQEAWEAPVIMIWGNHETYRSVYQDQRAAELDRLEALRGQGYDIRVLHQGETFIGDTRILGATLWTDFDILGQQEKMMFGAEYIMRDYSRVEWREQDGGLRNLRASDTVAMHASDRAWLLGALATPHVGRTLVMTHHLPAPELLAHEAKKGGYAPGYVSDMRRDFLGLKIDAWVTGHTHWARRGTLQGAFGPIAFTANMMGYEGQGTNFEPYRILDMDQPALGLEPICIDDPVLRRNCEDLPSADMTNPQF
ncbi:metallophosphoesterase [Defluviimonas salinarum]|uniref:Metallophosphoesterase n=1 Tax=Defluviimonas salinarum TaxID=2992147 RepID=A0ABT3J5L8_9RHOB|nr:metallophosphoesterase [Defluviimonas salinarum]MCW3782991.1 metallophosphoesterase [Defluviimonas salinarum]